MMKEQVDIKLKQKQSWKQMLPEFLLMFFLFLSIYVFHISFQLMMPNIFCTYYYNFQKKKKKKNQTIVSPIPNTANPLKPA